MLVAIRKAKLPQARLQQDDRRNEWDYSNVAPASELSLS